MTGRALLLVGSGGLAAEALEAVRAAGVHHVVGVLDEDPATHGRRLLGVPVLGGLEVAATTDAELVLCPGQGDARGRLRRCLEDEGAAPGRFATIVHPDVRVPASCEVSPGCIVLGGVVLTARIRLGHDVVLMPGVVLTHDVEVADQGTLASGVLAGGGVKVGRAAYLGAGASVRQGLTIGDGAMVGMGAVVLDHVPAGRLWFGQPARDRGAWPPPPGAGPA